MKPHRPTRLQIYGERCSGTNWVAQLCRRNFPGLRPGDDFGWKHGWIQGDVEQARDCLFVVVHRDPFDWLRSLHRQPWHTAAALRDVPFAHFIREAWHCEWGRDMDLPDGDPRIGTEMLHERDPRTGARFANAMRLRTAKHRAWDTLRGRVAHLEFVRYEDVLRAPREFVAKLARTYGLRRWPWFRGVDTFKGGAVPFRPSTYAPIDAADLDWIAAELDAACEAAHGYDIAARIAELRAAALDPPTADGKLSAP